MIPATKSLRAKNQKEPQNATQVIVLVCCCITVVYLINVKVIVSKEAYSLNATQDSDHPKIYNMNYTTTASREKD